MQVKAEEAELERHGHDEPGMLFGKDVPIDLAHYYCHCEADKDAHDERAHAQGYGPCHAAPSRFF